MLDAVNTIDTVNKIISETETDCIETDDGRVSEEVC